MKDRAQTVGGSLSLWGPQPPSIAQANIEMALSLASIDAKLAACDTNNVRFAPDVTLVVGNDELHPVPVRGVVAIDPSQAPLALPINAAQEAGGNLAAIAARTPALGPAPMAASTPVAFAIDQPALPLSLNAATEDGHLRAIRDTENSILKAALAAQQYQSMMSGAFFPTQELY